jgi:transposase
MKWPPLTTQCPVCEKKNIKGKQRRLAPPKLLECKDCGHLWHVPPGTTS